MAAQRTIAQRAIRQESEALLRQLETSLAAMRATRSDAEVERAERLAGALRQLVADTAGASASDRARVRAAVHHFVYRGDNPSRPGGARLALLTGGKATAEERSEGDEDRVIHDMFRALGRTDLIDEH